MFARGVACLADLLEALGISYAAVSADGEKRILRDVSLTARAGEVIGLVGPNGAGKTTLLKALAGLLPVQGEVRMGGRPLSAWRPRAWAKQCAYMHQDTQVPFSFTARQVVEMGRFPHRSTLGVLGAEDAAIVDAALGDADCGSFADQPVTQLSGGERQRVMLARALAQQTPVLLLDEPTASLDARFTRRVFALARELAARGRLVVLVAHDLRAAAMACDRVVLLSDGSVIAQGAPRAALTEAALSQAYGVQVRVFDNPAGQWDYYIE